MTELIPDLHPNVQDKFWMQYHLKHHGRSVQIGSLLSIGKAWWMCSDDSRVTLDRKLYISLMLQFGFYVVLEGIRTYLKEVG